MPTIVIDDIEYDIETLSDAAKAQLASLQIVDRRLAALQEDLAIHQTARNAYAQALKELLAGELPVGRSPDTQIQWPN